MGFIEMEREEMTKTILRERVNMAEEVRSRVRIWRFRERIERVLLYHFIDDEGGLWREEDELRA